MGERVGRCSCVGTVRKRMCQGDRTLILARERHTSVIDHKGLRQCLCDMGVRAGDTENVRSMVMVVMGVCALMDGLGWWWLESE